MTEPHIRNLLGGYSLGILDTDEQRAVDGHLAGCAECRAELVEVSEAKDLLALLPADEARSLFADQVRPVAAGPIEDDLVLRRTLRVVRAEQSGQRYRRLSLVAAAVAVLIGGAVVGGYVAGDRSSPGQTALPTPSATATQPGQTFSNTNGAVTATVNVTPVGDWVRFAVKVKGVAPGVHCRIIAISRNNSQQVAGSWVIGQRPPPATSTGVPGSAAMAPSDLAAVAIETEAGRRLVTVPV
jgi:hypothetical protein